MFDVCVVVGIDAVAMISVAILVVLFSIQRFGTDKVGYTFAPAILVWLSFIGVIGIVNLIRHDHSVLKAFNPVYIVYYFQSDPKKAWVSLGGVVLCMTGMLLNHHLKLKLMLNENLVTKKIICMYFQELKPCLLILVISLSDQSR